MTEKTREEVVYVFCQFKKKRKENFLKGIFFPEIRRKQGYAKYAKSF